MHPPAGGGEDAIQAGPLATAAGKGGVHQSCVGLEARVSGD